MGSPTLVNLPTETLTLIFNTFCLHCSGEHRQPCGMGTLPQHQQQRQIQQQRKEQEPDTNSWYSFDRRPLWSLCLVSKRIQDVAQPILYHEFVLGYGDSWRSEAYAWHGRLTSFVRTMASRRDLAGCVKIVSIQSLLLDGIQQDEARIALMESADVLGINLVEAWEKRKPDRSVLKFPSFLRAFLREEAQLSVYSRNRLANAFRYPQSPGHRTIGYELVAMLLAQLPNLDRLSFQDPFTEKSFLSPFPLPALSALNISSLPFKTLDLGIPALPILELATGLETLNIQKCDFPSPIPPLPNLKFIRITNLDLSGNHLRNLLSSCTGGLRTFVYEAVIEEWRGKEGRLRDGNNHFRLSEAVKYLRPHRDSLQTLHLDLRAVNIVESSNGEYGSPGFGLKGFTVLEHLLLSSNAIPIPSEQALYGFDSLIHHILSSIISLHLPHGQSWACPEKELIRLANQMKLQPGAFPKLQRVIYDAEHIFDDDTMGSMFAAVGVSFDYDSWPRSRHTGRDLDLLRQYEEEMSCPPCRGNLRSSLSSDEL